MTGPGKPMLWTRWIALIQSEDPTRLAEDLQRYMREGERFHVASVSVVDGAVRMVAEYQARGANRNDIQRRLSQLSIDPAVVSIRQSVALDLCDPTNHDAARALGLLDDEPEAEQTAIDPEAVDETEDSNIDELTEAPRSGTSRSA